MNSSQIPAKFPIAFASSAAPSFIQQVPTNYNAAIPGSLGLDIGFPPETFQDPTAGGTAPLGEYFNGLMNQTTACIRWIQAGGVFQYDATFQSAIGGYPKGAIVKAASYGAFWTSTVENNTTNPDTGTLTSPAAGWAVLQPGTYPWSQITGAPAFTLESEFTGSNQSLGTNGYQKLPGGLMMQWMDIPLTSVGSQVTPISWPTPFPGSPGVVFKPLATIDDENLNTGSASNQILVCVQSVTLSGCNLVLGPNGGGPRNITVHVEVKGRWA